MLTDRRGVEIEIGDRVAYSATYGHGSQIGYGEVVDITPHTVLIHVFVPDPPKYRLDRDPTYIQTHRSRNPSRNMLVLRHLP